MDTSTSFVAVVLLLAANAFFVAAEFALVKARGFRIQTIANDGGSAAKLTVKIQANLEAYLAACQLGITMASLGLGWVGEPAVAVLLEPLFADLGIADKYLHTSAFITGFLIFSSLHIVIGEQVPKTFAIRKAEPVAIWVAYPLHVSYLMVWPLNWLLNKASGSLLSLFGVEEAGHGEVMSDAELKGLVATSHEHGELEDDKAAMLRNLFEFDQRQVGRVMIPRNRVTVLDLARENGELKQVLSSGGHSRFPLIDSSVDEQVIGIVLAKTLQAAMMTGIPEPWTELKSYSRVALVIPEYQRISELFEMMRRQREHMAVVVDEYGSFVGVVTLEDLIEEIVGEIHDETDASDVPLPVQIGDDIWEADGLVSLSDLAKATGFLIPDGLDANTISGLCMEYLERMPQAGEVVFAGQFDFTVESIRDNRVEQVRIVKRPDPESLTPTTIETGEGYKQDTSEAEKKND